ncbi:hypothetical protein CC78DRAFT_368512 [Lojkania enalia]|uniref:Uncharacterized protein n=1 Tax=Lojkania enalia TaxID=147567 RepID=A0A9P4N741_9PLEO|nr:hypothetical protein CC78DRAFT_368512 [Didymosphaeria enalia]
MPSFHTPFISPLPDRTTPVTARTRIQHPLPPGFGLDYRIRRNFRRSQKVRNCELRSEFFRLSVRALDQEIRERMCVDEERCESPRSSYVSPQRYRWKVYSRKSMVARKRWLERNAVKYGRIVDGRNPGGVKDRDEGNSGGNQKVTEFSPTLEPIAIAKGPMRHRKHDYANNTWDGECEDEYESESGSEAPDTTFPQPLLPSHSTSSPSTIYPDIEFLSLEADAKSLDDMKESEKKSGAVKKLLNKSLDRFKKKSGLTRFGDDATFSREKLSASSSNRSPAGESGETQATNREDEEYERGHHFLAFSPRRSKPDPNPSAENGPNQTESDTPNQQPSFPGGRSIQTPILSKGTPEFSSQPCHVSSARPESGSSTHFIEHPQQNTHPQPLFRSNSDGKLELCPEVRELMEKIDRDASEMHTSEYPTVCKPSSMILQRTNSVENLSKEIGQRLENIDKKAAEEAWQLIRRNRMGQDQKLEAKQHADSDSSPSGSSRATQKGPAERSFKSRTHRPSEHGKLKKYGNSRLPRPIAINGKMDGLSPPTSVGQASSSNERNVDDGACQTQSRTAEQASRPLPSTGTLPLKSSVPNSL